MNLFRGQAVLLVLLAGFAGETGAQEFRLDFGVEQFRWREYEAGARLLEETGPRLRLGGQARWPIDAVGRSALELRGALYFGNVDYDGQACDGLGNCVPFQTDVEYRGAFLEALLARRLDATPGELFLGGGIDGWQRDIEGRGSVFGVTENWTVFYVLAGGGVHWSREAVRYRARAGIKYPFYTDESAEDFGVTLNPDGTLSYFVRLSADVMSGGRPRWGLGVYYDSFRFDRSDPEIAGSFVVFQPESRQDTAGIFATVYLR